MNKPSASLHTLNSESLACCISIDSLTATSNLVGLIETFDVIKLSAGGTVQHLWRVTLGSWGNSCSVRTLDLLFKCSAVASYSCVSESWYEPPVSPCTSESVCVFFFVFFYFFEFLTAGRASTASPFWWLPVFFGSSIRSSLVVCFGSRLTDSLDQSLHFTPQTDSRCLNLLKVTSSLRHHASSGSKYSHHGFALSNRLVRLRPSNCKSLCRAHMARE